jgi:hypothetical protein
MKMKPLFQKSIFLVLLIGLTLSSCKKDTKSDPIIGTWTAGTTTFTAMVGDKTLNQYFIDIMGLTQEEADSYTALYSAIVTASFTGTITIKSNNTYTDNLGGSTDSGTWSLNSDQSVLTITSSTDGPTTLEVVELTSSKLRLHTTEITQEDLNSDGTDENITVTIDITFTK